MCGISGLIGNSISEDEIELCVKNSKDILKNRGPDVFEYKKIPNNGVICQSLLSISSKKGLDKQPFATKKGFSSFNGEIYNYLSIKNELIESDYFYNIDKNDYFSEISIIDALYNKYGVNGLNKLNGMFAIAIYSKGTEEIKEPHLLLVRDRLGVKPIYYGITKEGNIIYSSSCLLFNRVFANEFNDLSFNSLGSILVTGYIQNTNTLIKDVSQLAAGQCLIYRLRSKKVSKINYWSAIEESKKRVKEPIKIKESLDLIFDSIRLRSNASGGVGCLLSGGIDSSLVASIYTEVLGKKINTYSLGFKNKKFDESEDAIYVSRKIGSNHTTILYPGVSQELLSETLRSMHGFPIGDTSAICSYYLYKSLKQYERSFLGGDGGDEIFGGYFHHRFESKLRYLSFLPIKETALILKKIGIYNLTYPLNFDRLSAFIYGIENFDYCRQKIFWPKSLNKIIINESYKDMFLDSDPMDHILNPKFTEVENFARMRILDINNKLVNMFLPKTDMMSMANSIEIREPLLDFRLVNLLLSKGEENQIYLKNISRPLQKKLLKKFIPNYKLEKKKQGFSSPIDYDLRANKESLIYLKDTICNNQKIIGKKDVLKLIREQEEGINNSSKIFTLAAIANSFKDLRIYY